MNLRNQRRLAAEILKAGATRVVFNKERLDDAAEAITREDVKLLIKNGVISVKPPKGNSRGRIRKKLVQKKKGRMRGHGSRKGTKKARNPSKKAWANKIRAIRDELRKMKAEKKIDESLYRKLYRQSKGNLFHSRRHVREHVERMLKK